MNKVPEYKVNVNSKGEEWVKINNLVFKLRRDSENISLVVIDEQEKCAYTFVVDSVAMSGMDQLQWLLNRHVKVSEEQLLVLFDCITNYNLFGTMFKKHYKTTKKGNNYVETDKYLITTSRYGRAIVVKAIGEDNEYIIAIDERDIHNAKTMADHLDTLKLTISEFSAVLSLVKDLYYNDFGYKGE